MIYVKVLKMQNPFSWQSSLVLRIFGFKLAGDGVPWWPGRLKTQHCHCCGSGLILDQGILRTLGSGRAESFRRGEGVVFFLFFSF